MQKHYYLWSQNKYFHKNVIHYFFVFFRNSHTMPQFHRTRWLGRVSTAWWACVPAEKLERAAAEIAMVSGLSDHWGLTYTKEKTQPWCLLMSVRTPRDLVRPTVIDTISLLGSPRLHPITVLCLAPDTQPIPHCPDIYSELWFPLLSCSLPGVHTAGSNSHPHFPLSPDCPPLSHTLVLLPNRHV